ncbi:MAG: hypothetical protein ABI170_03130, partial [Microbacteriaceae bacterium]
QPGWTPPPKPGLIPLRPLSFGALLGAPFQMLRRNPKATFGSALLIQAVVMLATLVVVGIVTALAMGRIASAEQADLDAVSAGAVAGILLSALVPIGLSLVGAAFLQGIIVLEVARATLGEKLTMRQLWRRVRSRLGALVLWVLILAGIIIGVVAILAGIVTILVLLGPIGILLGVIAGILGLLAVLVLGAWLYTKLSLVPSLIVLEHSTIRASARRSWALTNGYFWRTFGVQVLIAMIVNLVSQIVVTPVTLVFSFLSTLIDPNDSGSVNGSAVVAAIVAYLVVVLISLVIGAITQIVQSAAIALIYIDLRMRKEGLDLDLVRFVEARQAGRTDLPDPYQTRAPEASGTAGR